MLLLNNLFSSVCIMHAYYNNIDNLYNTGWIDPPGIVKIVYIYCMHMCTCELK